MKNFTDDDLLNVQHTFLESTLRLFKHYKDLKYLERNFINILQSTSKSPRNYFVIMMTYMYEILDLPIEKVVLLLNTLPDKIKIDAMSTYDMIIEKGIEKGMERGMEEGIEKGMEEGRKAMTQDAIKSMKEKGFENFVIADILGLSLEDVNKPTT